MSLSPESTPKDRNMDVRLEQGHNARIDEERSGWHGGIELVTLTVSLKQRVLDRERGELGEGSKNEGQLEMQIFR